MDTRSTGTRRRRSLWATRAVACSTTLSLLWAGGGLAVSHAQDSQVGASPSALVSEISSAQSRIDELDVVIGGLRESVNAALVDLHDSQSRAEQARRGAIEAKRRLEQAQSDVEEARKTVGEISRAQYRQQGAPSVIEGLTGSSAQQDLLDRSLYLRRQSEDTQATLDAAEKARAEAANEESTLRLAAENEERAAQAAQEAEASARAQLEKSQSELDTQLAARDAAVEQHAQAQQQLEQARPGTSAPAEPAGSAHEESAPAAPAPAPEVSQETVDTVREAVAEAAPEAPEPSKEQVEDAVKTATTLYSAEAGSGGSSEASSSSSSEIAQQASSIAAASALVGSSQAPHSSFDSPYDTSTADLIAAFSQGLTSALTELSSGQSTQLEQVLPDVPTSEQVTQNVTDTLEDSSTQGAFAPNTSKVETVIARAQSVIGTPYVWGGGDANGPTVGVDGGSLKGFDCSGLVLYAFAAAGISLPHYSGYQYQRGTQIDPSQAQRGDLLFWGPGGSSHVAIYLGDGTMIEAPQSGQTVQVSQVRWSGMSPKAVRLL